MTGSDVLVLLIACTALVVVALAAFFLTWRVQRRLFDGYRDMLKAVLVTHASPIAPHVGAAMEETDRQVLVSEAKAGKDAEPKGPRMAI